jgi:GT2 family glycosyltransferase
MQVTATVSTKDRYFTTLPLMISAVCNQTILPKKLIIFDDGEQRDLRENGLYKGLFSLLSIKGIEWEVSFGARIGQVANHQRALGMAKTDFIWRLDDDQAPEPNVLECLLRVIRPRPEVGAVGGLIIDPLNYIPRKPKIASNKIEDIYIGMNEQWFPSTVEQPYEVDHLYSSFVFRKEAAPNYPTDLSPVGHREETIFTYEMKLAGWKILIQPVCKTWHLRNPEGGIRSYTDGSHWASDERKFVERMLRWGVNPTEIVPIVLNCGLGDHIIFKNEVWPLVREKATGKKIVMADCYPEVFEDEPKDFVEISIAEGQMIWNLENYDVYKYCGDKNLRIPIAEGFKRLYGVA